MTVAIHLRKATQRDREVLCQIHVSSIRELGKSHYSEAEVDAWSSGRTPERYERHIADRHVVVAQHGSKPVGFGTLDVTTGDILQIYVRPEYARKGIGRRILRVLLSEARKQSLPEVRCLSSLNAEAFYLDSDFCAGQRCRHRFPNGGEMDCIPMSRILDQRTTEPDASDNAERPRV